MKIIVLFLPLILTGCGATNYKESSEYKHLDEQSSVNDKQFELCIKKHINEYAANASASHTEVAEATVTSCRSQLASICNNSVKKHALSISNTSQRNSFVLENSNKCITKRSEMMRQILIKDLVKNRK